MSLRFARPLLGAIILTLLAFAGGGVFAPAHAQPLDAQYSIDLTIDGPATAAFGGNTSPFIAYFTHTVALPGNGETVAVFLDGSTSHSGSVTPLSSTKEQIYFSGFTNMTSGTHAVQARYYLTTTSTWIVSNTVTVTVGKGGVNFGYTIDNLSNTYAPGQNITLDLSMYPRSGNNAIDWAAGSFKVSFTGPSTVTYPAVKASAGHQVTVQVPKTPGQYQLACDFNGSALYAPASGDRLGVLVSGGHRTGTIRLYTNPTTIGPNQKVTWYVVIPAAPGLPTPTGYFDIMSGRASTSQIHLGANGTATVTIGTPTSVADGIQILYFGDGVYASETVSFGLTNPAIPAAGGGTVNPPTKPAVTPTATKKPTTPTPTAGATKTPTTATPTPGATPTAGATTGTPKRDGGTGPTPVVVGTLGFLALAASGMGGLFVWRRRLAVPLSTTDAPWPNASAAPKG